MTMKKQRVYREDKNQAFLVASADRPQSLVDLCLQCRAETTVAVDVAVVDDVADVSH